MTAWTDTARSRQPAPLPGGPDSAAAAQPSTSSTIELERAKREDRRLAALDRYDILDSPREEAFDRVARIARSFLDIPIAIVSFIDGHRQWYKACEGISAPEVAKEHAFCKRTIEGGQPIIVRDATKDQRFAQNPYVLGELGVRFYAGIPLQTPEGFPIGTLCVVDTRPRDISPAQLEVLFDLASIVMDELELRRLVKTDSLTGVLSRRTFKEEGARATALALRHHHELSCIVLDLDRFQQINDLHGDAVGDVVLKRIAELCVGKLRQSDLFGRLGGEEFAAVLPYASRGAALEVAEKLRAAIAAAPLRVDSRLVGVSASFGVASIRSGIRDFEALLAETLAALHEAKAGGRNRSVASRAAEPANAAQQRKRVFKAGQILFNGRTGRLDCTVRSLSDDGAGLDVGSSVGVPRRFDLVLKGDNIEKACRLVSQTEKHLEVEFV